MIDFHVLRNRNFALGCTFASLGGLALYGVIFLFPVYAQSLLGWTAWQSGLASLPSSVATAMTMAIMGRIIWHTGPRVLFLTGMVLMVLTLWVMSAWTLASGWSEVLPAQALRGVASGLLFVPLSAATLRALPSADVAKGTGLYNLFRQLGGSFGIAALAAILDRRTDIHRTEIARHLSPMDASTVAGLENLTQRLLDQGLDPSGAEFAARVVLDRMLSAQAMMESFYDAFFFIAVMFIILFPFAFLLPRHMPGKLEAERRAAETEVGQQIDQVERDVTA
jgi:DHA2 family multidrug resistance protein